MTIEKKYYEKFDDALNYLQELSRRTGPFVFRGHANSNHRLVNSWQRYSAIPHEPWMADIDNVLRKYLVGLAKIGYSALDGQDRFTVMEHGRHHGLPTPCLDFTYSPYVALFFAFNGVRFNFDQNAKEREYSVVYALNVNQLAMSWARQLSSSPYAIVPEGALINGEVFNNVFQSFNNTAKEFAREKFPASMLKFIPFPGKHNGRMMKQKGALLYDTLNYQIYKKRDLEDLIESFQEAPFDNVVHPCLHKIYIDKNCVKDVFSNLELVGATGGELYATPEGVAFDIWNEYNYNAKFSFIRDIDFHVPD